jgi:hypothetical protein
MAGDRGFYYPGLTEAATAAEIEALKLRELTDREIMELYCLTSDNDPLDFARAILQKASEQ